jgi:hypothetical protein
MRHQNYNLHMPPKISGTILRDDPAPPNKHVGGEYGHKCGEAAYVLGHYVSVKLLRNSLIRLNTNILHYIILFV